MTTLELIQDSGADYHGQTGALIVGDSDVAIVYYKGKVPSFSRLRCAGYEEVIIGKLLGVQPLLGQQATNQAVLERLHSVSLIHFAAQYKRLVLDKKGKTIQKKFIPPLK